MGSIVAEIADKIASAGGGERSELEVRGGVGADGGGILTLSTSELTVVDGDKLGRIDFQAPLETGTDAILVGASIYAEADDTFAADNNSTELVFAVGASEAAAEKMRLTHDGELGIGVTTPASLLHVAGTVQVGVDDTGHDVIFYGAAAGALMMWDQSADALLIRGATADAVATSAGRIVLQTNQAAVVDGDIIGRIDFQPSNETGADALLVGASIYAEADATFDASTNATEIVFAVGDGAAVAEVMRIDNDGNVGIGTASPITLIDGSGLHIKGASHATLVVNTTGSNGDAQLKLADQDTSKWTIYNDGGDSHKLRIASPGGAVLAVVQAGDVGIGTSAPASSRGYQPLLHLKRDHDVAFIIDNNTEKFEFCINNDADVLRLHAATADCMSWDGSSGNVGIGTAAPGIKLHVVGGAETLIRTDRTNSGQHINFSSNGSDKGNISESGGTVSYNAFTGSHWGRLSDNSKPTILKGTVLEMISASTFSFSYILIASE